MDGAPPTAIGPTGPMSPMPHGAVEVRGWNVGFCHRFIPVQTHKTFIRRITVLDLYVSSLRAWLLPHSLWAIYLTLRLPSFRLI
jgi:hypothetical protein